MSEWSSNFKRCEPKDSRGLFDEYETDPTEQVLRFEKMVQHKLDVIFPTKNVKINPNVDLPFITAELKNLDRLIKREYRKHSKSMKYLRLKKKYD